MRALSFVILLIASLVSAQDDDSIPYSDSTASDIRKIRMLRLLSEIFPHRNTSDFLDEKIPTEDFEEDFLRHLQDLQKMDDDHRRQGVVDEESQGLLKQWLEYLETRMVGYLTQHVEEGEGGVFSIFYSLVTKQPCPKKFDVICYGEELGCLGKSLEHVCRKPETPRKLTPEYRLFKKDLPHQMFSSGGKDPLQDVSFANALLPNKDLAIILHGFTGHPEDGREYLDIKNALLNSTSYEQVIMMNYSYAVRGPDYVRAMVNSEVVGRQIANFLLEIRTSHSIELSQIYFIGYSMGCQVAHFASEWIREKTNGFGIIGRITGLDPAAVLTLRYPQSQLSSDDASFVDVIHTSAGFEDGVKIVPSFIFQRVGVATSIGHTDFYPNGGSHHPQCKLLDFPSCKHNQALIYYANSITWCWYKSSPCSEVDVFARKEEACQRKNGHGSVMGFYAKYAKGGGHQYLATRKEWPHCLEKEN